MEKTAKQRTYEQRLDHASSAIDRAIHESGGITNLARVSGVSRQAIWTWRRKTRLISAEGALRIAQVTTLDPFEFRPDLFPNPKKD